MYGTKPLLNIKAWTCFRSELIVSMNGSIGEFLFQLLQQMHQGFMLRRGGCVLGQKHSLAVFAFDRLSFGINAITPVGTPNVANTNAIAIVSLAMCACLGKRTPLFNGTI